MTLPNDNPITAPTEVPTHPIQRAEIEHVNEEEEIGFTLDQDLLDGDYSNPASEVHQ